MEGVIMYNCLFLNFFIGACLASHACVIYDRFNTTNFLLSRSRCFNCNSELSILDEIPIISFLLLRGKCRYCKHEISSSLFLFELFGSFSFVSVDFFSQDGLITVIFIFSLLVIAIFDFKEQEFPIILLLLPTSVTLLVKGSMIFSYSLLDWLELIPTLLLMTFMVHRKKLGSGDLIIYMLIAVFFNPLFANTTLLVGSSLLVLQYLLSRKNEAYPFIPYIYLGMICLLLI